MSASTTSATSTRPSGGPSAPRPAPGARPPEPPRLALAAQVGGELAEVLGPDGGALLVIEERHEDETLAAGHRRRLVQQAAAEHRRPAERRPIGPRAEFGEDQVAAFVAVVEVQADGELAVRGAGGDVVA